MRPKLVPYAGAERRPVSPPGRKMTGAELLEQMIIDELGSLNRKMAKAKAELAALHQRLAEIRNAA